MFQQGGEANMAHAEASHPGPKSARALRAELDEIFAKEARTGVKADPERVAAYVAAIEDAEADQHSAAQPQEDFEKTWTHFTENHPDLFPPTKTKTRKWGRRILHFVEAAALIAVVLVVTAAACGWQDYFLEWGRELLRITPTPSGVMALAEPNTDGYSTLAEAVAGAGMEDARIPTWIPARFAIKDLAIQELNLYTAVTGIYVTDESDLVIRIARYTEIGDMPDLVLEKNNDDTQEKVFTNGITYLYSENFETLRITWKDGNFLYNILGKVSNEEMDRIVNSFYGG